MNARLLSFEVSLVFSRPLPKKVEKDSNPDSNPTSDSENNIWYLANNGREVDNTLLEALITKVIGKIMRRPCMKVKFSFFTGVYGTLDYKTAIVRFHLEYRAILKFKGTPIIAA